MLELKRLIGRFLRLYWHILLALVFGLGVGLYVYGFVGGVGRLVPAVLAAEDIPPATRLRAGMIRVAHLPAVAVHSETLTNPDQAIGQEVQMPLRAGEQILAGKLEKSPLPPGTDAGERVMYIPLNGGGGYPGDLLRPGLVVDLVFVSARRTETDLARLLLIDLKVVSVEREKVGAPFGGQEAVRGIVVAVSAPEAERLAYALSHGTVFLLVGSDGSSPPTPSGVTWENLFNGSGPLPPPTDVSLSTGESSGAPEVGLLDDPR